MKNLDKYKQDLDNLISSGKILYKAMYYNCNKNDIDKEIEEKTPEEQETLLKKINSYPEFESKYQTWYTESLALIKLLIPDRIDNFKSLYEKPKNRIDIVYGNYVIADYLQRLDVIHPTQGKIVGPSAALVQFKQQLEILKSANRKFESSLFDIEQIIQADLFDSELDAALELSKKGFIRGAGAIAGVVLEKHLSQICKNHKITISKKNPTIAVYNDKLKEENTIDFQTWRKIQLLGDLRNLCDHKKEKDPTKDDVKELIDGVEKTIKTLF